MYAIVDIETTGGSAAGSGITEIAIILHDGEKVEGKFSTLINPLQKIPRHITALTGISDYMVADAPVFAEVAQTIFDLLGNRIFVAHNVNFDYSFIYHHLREAGYEWNAKKVCTVRYARKVLPGKRSYSLGNICRDLDIHIEQRHRAEGDVEATVALWEQLLRLDVDRKHLAGFTKGKTPESYLPIHVPSEQMERLPYCPGVYYFKDASGKIVYVGKAKNLKFRVRSHFSNNSNSKRKQDFLRNIFSIEYKPCATELMALVFEELEIKRLWPLYNRSQKRFEQQFGMYALEDQRGLLRLAIEKRRKHLPALYSFHKLEEGYRWGRKLMHQFAIEENLLFFTGNGSLSISNQEQQTHNEKMESAIRFLKENFPTLIICQPGEDEKGNAVEVCYLLRNGSFAGMGVQKAGKSVSLKNIDKIITPSNDNEYIKTMLLRFAELHSEMVLTYY